MASADRDPAPHVHFFAGPVGTGRSRVASEFGAAAEAPVVVADRTQCYLDLAVSSGRPQNDTVTRYYLAARQVTDGEFPVDAATAALTRLLETLTEESGLVVVEGGSIALVRRLGELRDTLPFQLIVHRLDIGDPAAHAVHLRARALRLLASGMLEEFAFAWSHLPQRPFIGSVNGLDALARWCERTAVSPAELVSRPRDADLLLELAVCVADAHLKRAKAQEAAFSALFGKEPPFHTCFPLPPGSPGR
jgi:hypothetical protein